MNLVAKVSARVRRPPRFYRLVVFKRDLDRPVENSGAAIELEFIDAPQISRASAHCSTTCRSSTESISTSAGVRGNAAISRGIAAEPSTLPGLPLAVATRTCWTARTSLRRTKPICTGRSRSPNSAG
jgi:hypothetical protein